MIIRLVITRLIIQVYILVFSFLIFAAITVILDLNNNFKEVYAQDQKIPCPKTLSTGATYVDKQGCIQPCPDSVFQEQIPAGCPQSTIQDQQKPEQLTQLSPQSQTPQTQQNQNGPLEKYTPNYKSGLSDSQIIKQNTQFIPMIDYAHLTVYVKYIGISPPTTKQTICISMVDLEKNTNSKAIPYCNALSEESPSTFSLVAPGLISFYYDSSFQGYNVDNSRCDYHGVVKPYEKRTCELDITKPN